LIVRLFQTAAHFDDPRCQTSVHHGVAVKVTQGPTGDSNPFNECRQSSEQTEESWSQGNDTHTHTHKKNENPPSVLRLQQHCNPQPCIQMIHLGLSLSVPFDTRSAGSMKQYLHFDQSTPTWNDNSFHYNRYQ